MLHGSLGDKSPQQAWDDYAGVNLLRQSEAAKPEEKSRPVVEGHCAKATTPSYNLEFSGGEAIFAESRGKTVQNRLTNIELLSSFLRFETSINKWKVKLFKNGIVDESNLLGCINNL